MLNHKDSYKADIKEVIISAQNGRTPLPPPWLSFFYLWHLRIHIKYAAIINYLHRLTFNYSMHQFNKLTQLTVKKIVSLQYGNSEGKHLWQSMLLISLSHHLVSPC